MVGEVHIGGQSPHPSEGGRVRTEQPEQGDRVEEGHGAPRHTAVARQQPPPRQPFPLLLLLMPHTRAPPRRPRDGWMIEWVWWGTGVNGGIPGKLNWSVNIVE